MKKDNNLNMIAVLDKAIVNPEVDVEKMQALLDVQERIMNKQAEMAFNQAMVSAVSEIPSFEKSTEGHHYKYTTFEHINKVVKPILANHDLYVTFSTDFQSDDYVMVTAEITHKDGVSKKTSMRFPFDSTGSKNNVQAVASAISYGKRYMQNALLNITTHGEDDDGFASEATIGKEEINRLNAGLEKAKIKLPDFLKSMNVTRLSEIRVENYIEALSFITQVIKTQKPKANKKAVADAS